MSAEAAQDVNMFTSKLLTSLKRARTTLDIRFEIAIVLLKMLRLKEGAFRPHHSIVPAHACLTASVCLAD